MTPIDDPRLFAAVLADWIDRHGGSAYRAADLLRKPRMTLGRWLRGAPCPDEYAYRALMTLHDEGRISPSQP